MTTENILFSDTIEKTNEFHRTFGHVINAKITPEILALRGGLIHEEATELQTALTAKNHVEIVDALADILYVVAGTVTAISCQNHWRSLQDGAALISIMFTTQNALNNLSQDLTALSDESLELAAYLRGDAVTRDDAVLRCLCLIDLIGQVCDYAHIDIEAAFAEAHRSNMTKLWSDEAEERTLGVASDPVRYEDIAFAFRLDGGKGVIGYRTTDGKILKSPSYSDADFSPFVSDYLLEI